MKLTFAVIILINVICQTHLPASVFAASARIAPFHKLPLDNPFITEFSTKAALGEWTFTKPVFLTYAPEFPKKVFVVEQGGGSAAACRNSPAPRVLMIDRDAADGTRPEIFLNLQCQINASNQEEGLLGLAFDPKAPGVFYVAYTALSPRRLEVAEYRYESTDGVPKAIVGSKRVILKVEKKYSNHNGGMIAFGPDEYLYIGTGDGGWMNDPDSNGQSLTTLQAKILRIDPRNPKDELPYGIPADNPFVKLAAEKKARAEIWAYGVRNPWRFSFDRSTKDLWLGDVGQGKWEEVNVVTRGGNYGWKVFEGKEPTPCKPCEQGCVDGTLQKPLQGQKYIDPVFKYDRQVGQSITGGYVYRGSAVPALQGAYVYGDFRTNQVWALRYDLVKGELISNRKILDLQMPASFGEDAEGELYAVSYAGQIFRIVPSEGTSDPSSFPSRISKTGLFSNAATLSPEPFLLPYQVNSPLWSDGADKSRWMALPSHRKIRFSSKNAWGFPIGTAFVKHFEKGGLRLETRVFMRHNQGWAGYTYKWMDPQGGVQEDAVLIDESIHEKGWYYPSRRDCMSCHNGAAGFVLGANTHQLNRREGQTTESALEKWNRLGLFEQGTVNPKLYPALADPNDSSSSWNHRARSYLTANCAFCHRPDGPTPMNMDMTFLTPLSQTHLRDVRAEVSGSCNELYRIKARDKERSALWLRMKSLDSTRMPPLATHVVDEHAIDLIGNWIDRYLKENSTD